MTPSRRKASVSPDIIDAATSRMSRFMTDARFATASVASSALATAAAFICTNAPIASAVVMGASAAQLTILLKTLSASLWSFMTARSLTR